MITNGFRIFKFFESNYKHCQAEVKFILSMTKGSPINKK